MFAFRFVRPVTTASGKVVAAAAVGLGAALGGADAAGLAAGGCDDAVGAEGVGAGLSQAASSTAMTATAKVWNLRRARVARSGGAAAAGTPAMVVRDGVDRAVAGSGDLV
jgi:hypothetical protein